MAKKVNKDKQVKQAQETEHQVKQAKGAEHQGKAQEPRHQVMALEFLKRHGLDWVLERSLEEGDLHVLKAQVAATEDGEWASWWIPYQRADGIPVKGISWGISAPTTGGFVILRLVENRVVKATLKVWPGGRGLLMGAEPVVKALMGRPDLRPWSDEDLAGLL